MLVAPDKPSAVGAAIDKSADKFIDLFNQVAEKPGFRHSSESWNPL